MSKQNVDFVIIVLVYRNIDDLQEFVKSAYDHIKKIKIIIVNAFYDNESNTMVRELAEKLSCDFISIENRGYSYGNNMGIAYASEKYNYKYIIVSNPDIIVKRFLNIKELENKDIIAPKTVTASGKFQNPIFVIDNKISDWLKYEGYLHNRKLLVFLGIAFNKAVRELFLLICKIRNKKKYRVYGGHGSLIFLSKKAIEALEGRVFDDNMFLMEEENVLAQMAKNAGLETFFMPGIVVYHKEDGSMKLSDFSIKQVQRESFLYYYENYRKGLVDKRN